MLKFWIPIQDTVVTEYIDRCFSMFICVYGCVEGVGVAKKASISTYSSNNFIYIPTLYKKHYWNAKHAVY